MKAILVIDMPNECMECPCYDVEFNMCRGCLHNETIRKSKPDWCPLRPVPSEYCVSNKEDQYDNERYFYGYNKAIRDIVGDENIEY